MIDFRLCPEFFPPRTGENRVALGNRKRRFQLLSEEGFWIIFSSIDVRRSPKFLRQERGTWSTVQIGVGQMSARDRIIWWVLVTGRTVLDIRIGMGEWWLFWLGGRRGPFTAVSARRLS
jgi:hypothetical protein